MNIFEKLFKKNKLNSEILSLVNLQDSIIMPPDTFFENNKNKEICERYYQEYKNILSSKKTILSIHLKDTETDDIRVYIDILTSLEIHIHDILSNPNNKSYNYEYITNLLTRLKGYTLLLKSIEEESFLRLAALSSLKATPFLSRNKKNAIDNEISRLQIQIFNAQKDIELINLQINSCLSIIDNLKVEKNPQYYLDLRSRLFNYIGEFDFNLLKEFVDNFQNKSFLPIAQIKLEKILFTNKNILKDLEKDYIELLATTDLDRKSRIHKINRLIFKYMAIKEYKRIEDKNLLYKLVEYKINSYEIDYKNHQEILKEQANFKEEKKIMQEVLFKKVCNFMQNPNVFEEYKKYNFSKRDYRTLANLINSTIKNNDIYDYGRIICSPELTALIFSIDNPNKMKDFFQNYKVSDCTYLIATFLNGNMFDFEEYIKLETIMQITDELLKHPYQSGQILKDKELYDLYKIYNFLLYTVLEPKNPSHIFDNVSMITITGFTVLFYQNLIKTFNKEMSQERKIIFPKTLKKLTIHVDNFSDKREYLKYYEFELNEGLEELTILEADSYATPPKVLELPTTLEYLTIGIRPETIRFRDYTNSKLIKDKKSLKNFLKDIMHTQTLFMSNDSPPIKTLEFKGKSSFTTFSLNIEPRDGHYIYYEVLYNDFQNKVKEAYKKLYEVAQIFEFDTQKKKVTFNNLKILENELYNYVCNNFEKLTNTCEASFIENFQNIDLQDMSTEEKTKLLKVIEDKIIKYKYINEAIPTNTDTKNAFKTYINTFLEIKFKLLISNLPESSKPLIDDGTSKDRVELFKDLLIGHFKNLVIYVPKDKILSEKLDDIIEKYRGNYNYFEYLLRNTFLLRLKLSIEDPNYPEDAYKVFQNYIVKRPDGVLYDLYTERLRKSWGTNVSYAALMEHALEEAKTYKLNEKHIEYEHYLQDLSQIYISIKPQNIYYFPKGLEWYEIKKHCEIRDKKLESNIKNKHVIFPKGLKCFKIAKSYEKILIASLLLNEELIDLDINSIILNKIRIHPNLSFYVGTSPEITFINYENSNILNNDYLLKKFINNYLNLVYENRKIILESVSGKQYIIYIVDGSSEELAEELFQKIKEKLNQSKLVRKIDK